MVASPAPPFAIRYALSCPASARSPSPKNHLNAFRARGLLAHPSAARHRPSRPFPAMPPVPRSGPAQRSSAGTTNARPCGRASFLWS